MRRGSGWRVGILLWHASIDTDTHVHAIVGHVQRRRIELLRLLSKHNETRLNTATIKRSTYNNRGLLHRIGGQSQLARTETETRARKAWQRIVFPFALC